MPASSRTNRPLSVAGIGCCLIDHMHNHFSYGQPGFQQLLSRRRGDGGIVTGGLVFAEDVEAFAGRSFPQILHHLVGSTVPDVSNLGGPSVVALVHCAQLLAGTGIRVHFHGAVGDDSQESQIRSFLQRTPLDHDLKTFKGQYSPSTVVLSDPSQHEGKGERTFINTLGAAAVYGPEDVPQSFYEASIVLCGGTALVPRLHDQLGTILRKAKSQGCLTVVGTVYDFRNEKAHPGVPWPLGGLDSYRSIDVLITDAEEALHLTGASSVLEAARAFITYGVGALFITHGAKEILVWSRGDLFCACPLSALPVSQYVDELLERDPSQRKDTTGCGDNFVGGVLASICLQLGDDLAPLLDIREACAWGASSGGFTCTYHGGTFYEAEPGEKRAALEPIVAAYRRQVGLAQEGERT